MKRKSTGSEIAKMVSISQARGMEATIKAQLITAILATIQKKKLTHVQVAKLAKLPRSAVTGILSGSLQKVTIDRVLRLIEAVGLIAEVRVKNSAA
ncbi:MAG: XRE family transcriptional regulator [Oligoflexia bacterium]|nr:XRE family transcriptional regulator [Oligoflexia bacterium]